MKASVELFAKLKDLFKGHPGAEALIAQAEAEQGGAPEVVAPEQKPEGVAQVAEAVEVADVDAPHPRNVTLRARYDAERAK